MIEKLFSTVGCSPTANRVAPLACRRGGDLAEMCKLFAQLRTRVRDVAGGFDLAGSQLELQIDTVARCVAGDGGVPGHRLAGVGIDGQELFLYADARALMIPGECPGRRAVKLCRAPRPRLSCDVRLF